MEVDVNMSTKQRQEYNVFKKNSIIQKSRYSLTLNQQKTLLYLISMVKEQDDPNKIFKLTVSEYCKVAGIKAVDGYYDVVKADIQAIADASLWIPTNDGKEQLIRWLQVVTMDKGESTIEISFTQAVVPFLFFMTQEGNYTNYPLLNILPMRCQYSIRLYEILKSYQRMCTIKYSLDELKQKIGTITVDDTGRIKEDYTTYYDFKRYVLDRAIKEINQYTDLTISYTQEKTARKVTHIAFTIASKKNYEKLLLPNSNRCQLEEPVKKHHSIIATTPLYTPSMDGSNKRQIGVCRLHEDTKRTVYNKTT